MGKNHRKPAGTEAAARPEVPSNRNFVATYIPSLPLKKEKCDADIRKKQFGIRGGRAE